ncbi:hypothetical protein [Paraburkholderia atlantica]|uniref:hypothetical protein n=1 Tax=Paraburkholderia atlantica TaxID=2654982 RepID=UPI003D2195D2
MQIELQNAIRDEGRDLSPKEVVEPVVVAVAFPFVVVAGFVAEYVQEQHVEQDRKSDDFAFESWTP